LRVWNYLHRKAQRFLTGAADPDAIKTQASPFRIVAVRPTLLTSIMKFKPSSISGMAIAIVLALASSAHAQPVSLRILGAFGAEHPASRAVEVFKTEVERRSQGSLNVDIVADINLGAKEIIDGVRADSIFATWAAIPYVSRLVPELEALSLPFVFTDYDQVMRAANGPVGHLIETKLAAKGFTTLGWMELGKRHVTNSSKPLKTLNDFRGLKIRLQPSETHLATFRALGANPVAMDIKEVYQALQQADIVAEENPYTAIYANKFFEVQKYLSDSGHILDLIIFIASKQALMRLSPTQQEIIRGAAKIAAAQQREMATAAEEAALVALEEKGMQFDPLPPATRAAMRKATAVVIDRLRDRVGSELVDKVVAETNRP
jgi:TRAP-type transport system periplasmic protein